MKKTATLLVTLFSLSALAQNATVDVTLRPAGSFKGSTTEVTGFATQKGDSVEAKDIKVNLKSLKTGIKLRDEHTGKYLETSKHPEAVLLSATGKGGNGEGTIRIKGIEKKVTGTYKIEGSNLVAQFPIKFSDFKITGVKYMGVGVDDDGVIHVTVPIKK
jgi:polyisoprenoid-binding protein YceI